MIEKQWMHVGVDLNEVVDLQVEASADAIGHSLIGCHIVVIGPFALPLKLRLALNAKFTYSSIFDRFFDDIFAVSLITQSIQKMI